MRKFFKPIEIDEELEEHFDLSAERGYLSTEQIVGNTTTDCNDTFKEKENETSTHRMPNENHTELEFDIDTSSHKTPDDFDERMRLKVKLEQLYGRYCDAKKRQAKWNELDERVSKSSTLDKRVPSTIIDMLTQFRSEATERHVFRTNLNSCSNRSIVEKMNIMMLMSFLRLPEERSIAMTKKNIKSESVDQFEDTQRSFLNATAEHESKYASQLKQSPKQTASTAQAFASSTPHKLLYNHQNSAVPTHSPIVGISRTNQIDCHSDRRSRINKDDPKWYLKYLGLNSISDLFSDDENDEHEMDICDKNQSDDQETQLCKNLNKSICGNDNLIEEKSQYTVSRILKICEDAERERGEKNPNSELVTTRRNRLYIGSVDDLFCDDDDDDDNEDDAAIINSQFIGVTLSSSDDTDGTINYDVEDAMLQHKNQHHCTNLFKDSIEGEVSHHFSNSVVKSVANTKSDELFSTYNETVANSSKASANCTKNSTIKNQSPQREYNMADDIIPTTPTKCNSSNFFAYYSRSPSVLIKSSSILSAHNHNTGSLTNRTSDSSKSSNNGNKSPTSLSFKLSALNSQLSLSKHFDDFDEIKENFDIDTNTSPFATCQTSRTTYRNQQRTYSPNPSNDTFATCQSNPVN